MTSDSPKNELFDRLTQVASRRPMGTEAWEVDLSLLKLQTAVGNHEVFRRTVCVAVYGDRFVRVKVMELNDDDQVQSVQELLREKAAVWRTVDHPNVTKFVGASVMDCPPPLRTCCVVVEEYFSGETLEKYLSRNKVNKLPFEIVLRFALDLARGLQCLHSKNITHCELRTENIIVSDSQTSLKILDFVAAAIEQKNVPDDELCGIEFMAPELVQGSNITLSRRKRKRKRKRRRNRKKSSPFNRKADVYSFGICLWEIYCCDDKPYPGLTIFQIISSLQGEMKHFRPIIPSSCPKSLATIMCRCWGGNPNSRPSILEVVRLLEFINPSEGGFKGLDDQMGGLRISSHRPEVDSLVGRKIRVEHFSFAKNVQIRSILLKLTEAEEGWEIERSLLQLKTVITRGDDYAYNVYGGIYDGNLVTVKARREFDHSPVLELLRQEGAVWQTVNHPSVVKFWGASFATRKGIRCIADLSKKTHIDLCVVFEYVAGVTLKNLLSGDKLVPVKKLLKYALDIAQGLCYLHSKNIVHCGVKTDYMVLMDNTETLKIADFVTAQIELKNPSYGIVAVSTADEFTAPEVIRGEPYNNKCDVYSFGICLWEMFCRRVWSFPKYIELTPVVMDQNLRPWTPEGCPISLANVMCNCWDANPDNRPEMIQVVRSLEAAIDENEV